MCGSEIILVLCLSHDKDKEWAAHALFPDEKASLEYFALKFRHITADYYSYTIAGLAGIRVDVVRSIINLTTINWVANYMVSYPLHLLPMPLGLLLTRCCRWASR